MRRNGISSVLFICMMLLALVARAIEAGQPSKSASSRYASEVGRYQDTTENTDDPTADPNDYRTKQRRFFDASKLTPSQILEHFGLGHVVPDILNMLDHGDELFSNYTQDKHFRSVNKIIAAFKQSFMMTLQPALRAPQRPSGQIDKATMDELFSVQEQQFHDILQRDPDVSLGALEPFFKQYVDVFFKTLKDAYGQVASMGITLNWTLLFMVLPYIEMLPTDLIDKTMFQDIIDVPGVLKQYLYDVLADVMSGDQAHLIRMITSFLSTIDFKQMMQTKVEL